MCGAQEKTGRSGSNLVQAFDLEYFKWFHGYRASFPCVVAGLFIRT